MVSFARVAVLLLEAVAQVRDERAQDTELLELCTTGAARSSAKMRAACLQVHAERASPILFKAVVRAVTNAFSEFQESVSTPTKLAVVALFTLSSIMPVTAWIRALVPAEEVVADSHVVVLAHDPAASLGVHKAAWKRALGAVRRRPVRWQPGASWGEDVTDLTALEIGMESNDSHRL